jgi:PPOX class probable F420-dependent enzyme
VAGAIQLMDGGCRRYGGTMTVPLDEAFAFVGRHRRGVLVTARAGGRSQLSNVFYLPSDDYSVRISVTDSRAKTRNLRRDPRASLHVTQDDFFGYVVLDGEARLSPVAAAADDAVVDELVAMYRLASGEHPDWDEFRDDMVAQARLVATLTATSAYGMLGG